MSKKKVNLYDRLPEIYRIEDEKQKPSGQLKNYISLFEEIFGAVHENIESLYNDLFIETCDDWVVPYIGDLLGNITLCGDPWTLRADVADTIALRRKKGTIAGIEQLTHNLTRWGVHCVELRETLLWNQHVNHQRPDDASESDDASSSHRLFRAPVRGGTVNMRDPALLSLVDTPFDPFSYTADLRPRVFGKTNRNLPNLAIFLWRLETYQVPAGKPKVTPRKASNSGGSIEDAAEMLRVDVHPLSYPTRLFNIHKFQGKKTKQSGRPSYLSIDDVTRLDQVPNALLTSQLNSNLPMASPEKYISINVYNPSIPNANLQKETTDVCLRLYFPPKFQNYKWSIRGANLRNWEKEVSPRLKNREIIVDPLIGRILIGVADEDERNELVKSLLVSYTYATVGPIGAHPIARLYLSPLFDGVKRIEVNLYKNPDFDLKEALEEILDLEAPAIIEINDSMVHDLDIEKVNGVSVEGSGPSIGLKGSLMIAAADGQRPIVRLLNNPLRFHPANLNKSSDINLRLEGLFVTRKGIKVHEPLIARLALNKAEIVNCTLDPGGYLTIKDSRAAHCTSIELESKTYGFDNDNDIKAFGQIPVIIIQRSITGSIFMDDSYSLCLIESIIDAGSGNIEKPASAPYALSGSREDPKDSWGPPTEISGVTVLGQMNVQSIMGEGGLWRNSLRVLNNQKGCLRFCYFSGFGDRLPSNYACVDGKKGKARLESECFNNPGYGQIALDSHSSIIEKGPNNDAMGAFGFVQEAHKWRNIRIRYREFMPVGMNALLIPVT